MPRLVEKIEITGTVTLVTGLHIGGSNSSMSIGGIDKSVVRNPLDNKPYIPGSSLKGKMRSLLEISIGKIGSAKMGVVQHGPAMEGPSAEIFGNATGNDKQRPSRVIVRDGHLLNGEVLLEKTDMPYTENKTEVVLDRITAQANPRQIERVPAGACFALNMILNVWEEDQRDKLIQNLFKALALLQDDYLGGCGSRGYGQIRITIREMISKKVDSYYGQADSKGEDIKNLYEQYLSRFS